MDPQETRTQARSRFVNSMDRLLEVLKVRDTQDHRWHWVADALHKIVDRIEGHDDQPPSGPHR